MDELDWNALARLFANELPEEEAAILRRWIEADPVRRDLVAALHRTWEHAGSPRQAWDAEAALREIRQRAERPTAPEVVPLHRAATSAGPRRASRSRARPRSAARRAAWRALPAAAAVLALVGTAGAWWLVTQREGTEDLSMAEVVTRRGERNTLQLDEGTRIVLGAASRLRFPERFGGRSRDVHLAGAGYFEVVHDPGRPFRVHTQLGTIEVLGTRFGVRAYAETEATEVVVAEGQVAVSPAGHRGRTDTGPVLGPGDLAFLDGVGGVNVHHGVDVEARLAWSEGRLVFRDAPLGEVLAELARWYDLDVDVADSSLAARPVTAAFDLDQPVDETLLFIASAVEARYERQGRTVRLMPSRRAP